MPFSKQLDSSSCGGKSVHEVTVELSVNKSHRFIVTLSFFNVDQQELRIRPVLIKSR